MQGPLSVHNTFEDVLAVGFISDIIDSENTFIKPPVLDNYLNKN
jgi:hypothetical protein